MALIDLHTHSIASDGTLSPTEIVHLASQLNLSAVALSDHDTVSGIKEFLQAGQLYPKINFIPGVEISVRLDEYQEVHIVGLFVDSQSDSLGQFLSQIRVNRNLRNEEMVTRLQSLGYNVTIDELLNSSQGESVGRPVIARLLVEKGYFQETQQVFDVCLRRGTSGYVPRVLPTPEEAIAQIHQANGVAIWAHPVYRRKNERQYVVRTLQTLIRAGLDGIETYYTIFTDAQHTMLKDVAEKNHLLQSGGSDFHGENQPSIQLGKGFGNLAVPDSLLPLLIDRHHHYLGFEKD